MLLSKWVVIKWNNRNKNYYTDRGYEFTNNGDEFYVNIKDVSMGSKTIIEILCDNCNVILHRPYRDYIKCVHEDEKYYCKKCVHSILNSKENNINYNINKTQEERENGRRIEGYTEFIKKVLARDNFTCKCCGIESSGNVVAHHLDGYDWCKEKRTDETNGITLCETCHKNFHSIYGYGKNTKEQFEEWIGTAIELVEFEGKLSTARKIYCIEEDKIYCSAEELVKEWGIKHINFIYKVCNSNNNKTIKNKHIIWLDKANEEYIDLILNYKNKSCKKVVCLNTKEIFEKMKDATKKYPSTSLSGISQCCNKIYKTSGNINGEKLIWMYYEEYKNKTEEEIYEHIENCLINKKNKTVLCVTTGEIFDSIQYASLKYNIKASNITMCCQGKYNYAGKINENILIWKYI